MQHRNTVLNQLCEFIPKNQLETILGQHEKTHGNRKITPWQQCLLMIFAQASGCESLRHLESVWQSQARKWYHLGIESVAKSTLSDANNKTNPIIYEKLFYAVLERYRSSLPKQKFTFEEDLYLLDGSIISLVYGLFDWAKYRKTKGSIRLHTVFCATEQIPHWINITNGKSPHEMTVAKKYWKDWNLPKGSILCFDRGYTSYKWWYELHQAGIYWIVKAKKNSHFYATKKYESDSPQVLSDEEGFFIEPQAENDYPEKVRRIQWYSQKHDKILTFFTNHHDLAPEQIAEAHKTRWQIELFFKWIKQHLKIKTFLGTSQNAVMSQIWIALIYFVILAYIKAKTKLKQSLFILSKVFAQALFERIHIIALLGTHPNQVKKLCLNHSPPQLPLI